MCLAVFALNSHPEFPVIVAANRDESHARATQPAAPWPDRPDIIGGLDLLGGGTWMGASLAGRYAFLTNFREPGQVKLNAPTRGAVVRQILEEDTPVAISVARIAEHGDAFNGFNLIAGDLDGTWYYSNRDQAPRRLATGVHGVSNHLIDTPWPKLIRVKEACLAMLAAGGKELKVDILLDAFMDRSPATEQTLPHTGLSPARERLLSSPFIASAEYGTRSTTLLLLRRGGGGEMREQAFDAAARPTTLRHWRFDGHGAAYEIG
jgi:uncharacterized protein with NRDE domain